MSSLEKFIQLQGNSTDSQKLLASCPACGCKDFYKQSDFKRSLGLWVVSIASVVSVILMAMGYNWFIIWSPFVVALLFDRGFYSIRPLVAICYGCKHVVRGISKADLEEVDGFELEIYDRYKYKEQNQQ